MTGKELLKRYLVFIAGLFFTGIGVAFTKHGELGVSPTSSFANVMSMKFTFLSMGNWLVIWNVLLIFGQILILRKAFKLYQLLQLPLSFIFGYFTDFGMRLVSPLPTPNYVVRLIWLMIGIFILAFGVSLTVIANVIMNSGEAFVKAIADQGHFVFGNVKVGFDLACVMLSVVLSLVFFQMRIVGTREGTVISALCTGLIVKTLTKRIQPVIEGFFR